MRLYDISEQFKELQNMAENDESMAEAVRDTLELVESDFNEKAQAIVAVALNMESDIAGIDEQIQRLTDRKKTIQNRTEWLRNYLRTNMAATGIKKISCPLFTITLADPVKQVEITNEAELPDDYVTVKTVIAPDKRKILADLKAGVDIQGACLVDGTQRLTIK